jgi:hypothetical protein
MSAKDGKVITTLPLAGSSDGAVFNPATMEAFSTHGNGTMTIVKEKNPISFEVEQNLPTMNGARTTHSTARPAICSRCRKNVDLHLQQLPHQVSLAVPRKARQYPDRSPY